MPFDLEGARKEGTDTEILDYLGTTDRLKDFDLEGARKEGSDSEILDYLNNTGRFTKDLSTKVTEPAGQVGNEVVDIIPSSQAIQKQREDIATTMETQTMDEEARALHEKRMKEDELYALEHSTDPGQAMKYGALEQPLLDPMLIPLEAAASSGLFKGVERVVDSIRWPDWLKSLQGQYDVPTLLSRTDLTDDEKAIKIKEMANEFEAQKNLLSYMDEQDLIKTDVLVRGSTGKDLATYLKGENVFAVKEAFDASEKVQNEFLNLMEKSLGKLSTKGIDPTDITTWEKARGIEHIVTKEVQDLRQKFKDAEKMAYSKADKIATADKTQFKTVDYYKDLEKTLADEGVDTNIINTVRKITNRFAKPYKEDTARLKELYKTQGKLASDIKRLTLKQKEAVKKDNDTLFNQIEKQLVEMRDKSKSINQEIADTKDIRYMNSKEIIATIKQINSKIFKPGGSVSVKDMDELRGLQIAKNSLEKFFANNIKNDELRSALREAKDYTIIRTDLFGAKDTGGEKLMLAKMLQEGEFNRVNEFITGVNGKENTLYVRDLFGKDSEAYKSTLSLYVNQKLGLTPDLVKKIKGEQFGVGIYNRVDLNKVAANFDKLDNQDYTMIREVLGKDSVNEIRSLEKLAKNYGAMEALASKYETGITRGVSEYIKQGEGTGGPIGRTLKVVKDWTVRILADRLEKIVHNQPFFRLGTGALTAEALYLAQTEVEDITLSGMINSMIAGGSLGYVAGRATRSLLEGDIKKVERYIKLGRLGPNTKNLPVEIKNAMERIGNRLNAPAPTLRQEILDKPTISGREVVEAATK